MILYSIRAQLYGVLELRNFSEPVPNFTGGSLDTGDAENNVLLLQITKDVSPDYSIEVQYGRYRNESLTIRLHAIAFTRICRDLKPVRDGFPVPYLETSLQPDCGRTFRAR